MPEKEPKQKIRLNLDISPTLKARLEQLQYDLDASSNVEVIRRAVAAFEFLTQASLEGKEFYIENPTTRSREKVKFI